MIASFGIKDIIDIVIVALLLFYLYRIMKESGTISIFYGFLLFCWFGLLPRKQSDIHILPSRPIERCRDR
ncbi:MAG: hypothetical protein K2M80_01860 [Muribaculaceae bacterium]|nr:hypothetical protein [Muribaculaceae bacterium]